jgi:hypothetical protein
MERFAKAFGSDAHVVVTYEGLMVTLELNGAAASVEKKGRQRGRDQPQVDAGARLRSLCPPDQLVTGAG